MKDFDVLWDLEQGSLLGLREDAPRPPEKSYRKLKVGDERQWFANLLWRAFPEATSENELSHLVAEMLTDRTCTIHPKTVRNWLRCENTPHFRYVMRVIALAGAEAVIDFIYPEA